MLLAISILSYAFSAVEHFGYGHVLQRYLHAIRLRSMQMALRDGKLDPRLSDFLVKVAGFAIMFFFAVSAIVTIILVPVVLIFGQQTASGLISGKWTASALGLFVFGPMAIVAAIGVAYVVWCVFIDLLAKGLDWAHQSSKGLVSTVSFAIGTISFVLDRIFT